MDQADIGHIAPGLRGLAVAIEQLSQDPANVRRHGARNLEAIKASLKQFGQQKPIVVDAAGVVIAGNGALEAARALGWHLVAAVRSDLAGAVRAAFAIADNRTAELAEWDGGALARQLAALQEEADIEMPSIGFTDEEIQRLVDQAGAGAPPPAGGGDDVPECFQVVVECRSEDHQRELYQRLQAEGLKCRLLML